VSPRFSLLCGIEIHAIPGLACKPICALLRPGWDVQYARYRDPRLLIRGVFGGDTIWHVPNKIIGSSIALSRASRVCNVTVSHRRGRGRWEAKLLHTLKFWVRFPNELPSLPSSWPPRNTSPARSPVTPTMPMTPTMTLPQPMNRMIELSIFRLLGKGPGYLFFVLLSLCFLQLHTWRSCSDSDAG